MTADDLRAALTRQSQRDTAALPARIRAAAEARADAEAAP